MIESRKALANRPPHATLPAVRPGFLLASFSACALAAASPARAESLAPALVRLLASKGNPHPLADATGRIPLTVALPPGADAAALGLLQVAPGVGAIRLPPAEVAPFAAAHPGLALDVAPPLHALLDVSGTWTHVSEFHAATGYYGQGVIVGIIDTGLDVRHPDFLTADGHTRVAWMLAAGPPAGLHPEQEAAFGCTDPKQTPCAVYAAVDLDAMIQAGSSALGDPEGHGTHVSSIAAGNGGPSVTKNPTFIGLAPEATLIVAAPTTTDAFVTSEILNAARFVFDRAEAVGGPVVVNISLGTDYGSHDGTGSLETGLAAMVGDDQPGRAIVVAAGNSGALTVPAGGGDPQGIHTEAHVADGEEVRVPIAAGGAMNGQGYVWITFRPGDDVDVGLEGPGGSTWVGLTGKGSEGSYQTGSGMAAVTGVVVNNLPSADAELTAATNSAVVVFTGHWADQSEFAIHLRGAGDASLWITAQGDAAQGLFFEKGLRQGTIAVPASAPGLLAVGCTLNRVSWTPLGGTAPLVLGALGGDTDPVADGACYFSARGPTPFGVEKPELSAPGGFVGAAMSADADPRNAQPGAAPGLFDLQGCPAGEPFCAVLDDYHALALGTSMSAPHVTGAVALLMEVDPSLTQARVTEVLQAGARLSHGHLPDPDQLGPGSLDVEGARLALLASMSAPPAPESRAVLVHPLQRLRAPGLDLARVGHRRAAPERRLHRRRRRRLQPVARAPGRRDGGAAAHPGAARAVALRGRGAARRSGEHPHRRRRVRGRLAGRGAPAARGLRRVDGGGSDPRAGGGRRLHLRRSRAQRARGRRRRDGARRAGVAAGAGPAAETPLGRHVVHRAAVDLEEPLDRRYSHLVGGARRLPLDEAGRQLPRLPGEVVGGLRRLALEPIRER